MIFILLAVNLSQLERNFRFFSETFSIHRSSHSIQTGCDKEMFLKSFESVATLNCCLESHFLKLSLILELNTGGSHVSMKMEITIIKHSLSPSTQVVNFHDYGTRLLPFHRESSRFLSGTTFEGRIVERCLSVLGVTCVTMMKLTIFCNSIFQSSSSPLDENAHNVLVIDFYNTVIEMKT